MTEESKWPNKVGNSGKWVTEDSRWLKVLGNLKSRWLKKVGKYRHFFKYRANIDI